MMRSYLVSPPIVGILPNVTTVGVFGSIEFVCSATGFGELSFAWYHDGALQSSISDGGDSSTLAFRRVLPQDRGQYTCSVMLIYRQWRLNSDAMATLIVNCKRISFNVL